MTCTISFRACMGIAYHNPLLSSFNLLCPIFPSFPHHLLIDAYHSYLILIFSKESIFIFSLLMSNPSHGAPFHTVNDMQDFSCCMLIHWNNHTDTDRLKPYWTEWNNYILNLSYHVGYLSFKLHTLIIETYIDVKIPNLWLLLWASLWWSQSSSHIKTRLKL